MIWIMVLSIASMAAWNLRQRQLIRALRSELQSERVRLKYEAYRRGGG
jgi:hypothetical protein